MSTSDKRVLMTKRFLKEALMDILRKKPMESVTVSELCRIAGVNRNTFYSHYNNPVDVMNEIEAEWLKEFWGQLEVTNPDKIIPVVVQKINHEPEFILTMISNQQNGRILKKAIDIAHRKSMAEWQRKGVAISEEDLNHIFEFLCGGTFSVLSNWIDGGRTENPQYIINVLTKLNRNALNDFFEE